jgi:hypothetical protein
MYLSHRGVFYNNEEVEVAVREWLQRQQPHFYHDGIFELVTRWDTCISVLGVCPESNDVSAISGHI